MILFHKKLQSPDKQYSFRLEFLLLNYYTNIGNTQFYFMEWGNAQFYYTHTHILFNLILVIQNKNIYDPILKSMVLAWSRVTKVLL